MGQRQKSLDCSGDAVRAMILGNIRPGRVLNQVQPFSSILSKFEHVGVPYGIPFKPKKNEA